MSYARRGHLGPKPPSFEERALRSRSCAADGRAGHSESEICPGVCVRATSRQEPAPQNAVADVRRAHESGSRTRCARFLLCCPKKPSWPSRPPHHMKGVRRHEAACPGSAGILPATGRRPAVVHAGQRPALPGRRPKRTFTATCERTPRIEPRRSTLGLDQHLLNRPVRHLHPRVEHRQQVLDRTNRVRCDHPQRHHRAAKLGIIDLHIDPRTPEQRRLEGRAKHRLHRLSRRMHRRTRDLVFFAQGRLRAVLVLSGHGRCDTLNLPAKSSGRGDGVRSLACSCGYPSPGNFEASQSTLGDFPLHPRQRLSDSSI